MRAFFYFTLVLVILVGLLAQDVDVDMQMGTEATANYFPLLRFASIGDVESVKDELRQGRDVNERSEDGIAAVHAAARYSHNEVLRVVSWTAFPCS
jgi:ankyrin repeat protein